MRHRQSTTEILKRKENFESVPRLKKRSTKNRKVIHSSKKTFIENITTVISLKFSTNFACDSRQQRVQFRAEYPRFVL